MKSKILFILHLPPPVHGAAIVGESIVNSQLLNNTFNCTYINLSTSSKMEEIGKGRINKLTNILKLYSQVIKALTSKKFDLCYLTLTASGLGFYKDLTIVALLKAFNKNIIFHFHNKGINSKNWFNNILYKFAFSNTKNILLSKNLCKEFKDYLKDNDTYYCPNGISVKEPSTIQKENSKCSLLFLSNMVFEKGILNLLKACTVLKEKNINFECHFVGAWSDLSESDFERLKNKYSLENIVFAHGAKFENEKRDFFLNADIFVLPTENDCFPLVLLEAMNYCLPIISTYEGGIPDMIIDNETGFIIPANIENELATKLEILINDPDLRRKFGINGRKRFLDLYTIEKFENNLSEILVSAIRNKKID